MDTSVIASWLRALKQRGVGLFVITNSKFSYANHIMSHSYGSNWTEMFDFIACDAGKPKFFDSHRGLGSLASLT